MKYNPSRRSLVSILPATLAATAFLFGSSSVLAHPGAHTASLPTSAPLVLEKSIPIPGVPVWLYSDVLAIDVEGGRVFATPQGANAVAVVDFKAGRVIKMLDGIGKLQGIYYSSMFDRLFVVDGKAGGIKVYNGADYSLIGTIVLSKGADSLTFDPKSGLLFVGNGGDDAGMDQALVSVVDPDKMIKLADIALPAPDVEALAVDSERQVLYANLVNDSTVAVIDLKKRQVVKTWKLPGENHYPFAMTVDSEHSRLYVVTRDDMTGFAIRSTLFVLDTNSGQPVATIPVGGWADGVFLDRKRNRIYVTTGLGRIETYEVKANDVYSPLASVDTPLLAKHGTFSPELDLLFVDSPHTGRAAAQVLIFRPKP